MLKKYLESILNCKPKKLYLASSDSLEFYDVREIESYSNIIIDKTNVLKIKLKEPVIGQKHGLGDNNIHTVYLIDRFSKNGFYNINSFPIDVYILIPTRECVNSKINHITDLQNIAWGSLYDNKIDATSHSLT